MDVALLYSIPKITLLPERNSHPVKTPMPWPFHFRFVSFHNCWAFIKVFVYQKRGIWGFSAQLNCSLVSLAEGEPFGITGLQMTAITPSG